MGKSLRLFVVLGVLAPLVVGTVWARRVTPIKTQYRWARMSIIQVLPSQVFAKLGLTHTTRYGFTRDGYTKKTPDPTFPIGLTDIVPYDVSHLLLVRGTPQALAQFRQRVLATEDEIIATGRWHVTAALQSGQDEESVGPAAEQDVATDLPFVVAVGDPAGRRAYRLRIHVNPDATTSVSCQAGLLPTPTAEAQAVLTPGQVWTAAVTRLVLPGGVVTFDDLGSARQTFLRRLNLPEETNAQDYRLRVAVTPPPSAPPVGRPPSALPPAETPPLPNSVATPSPEETNPPQP